MKETESWEVRFDKEFGEVNPDIKHFIRTEIEAAHTVDNKVVTKLFWKEGYELGVRVERNRVFDEVIEMIKENQKGTFTDDGGNDCWYIDDLEKKINQLKSE